MKLLEFYVGTSKRGKPNRYTFGVKHGLMRLIHENERAIMRVLENRLRSRHGEDLVEVPEGDALILNPWRDRLSEDGLDVWYADIRRAEYTNS